MGEHKQSLGGVQPHLPPVATALYLGDICGSSSVSESGGALANYKQHYT